MSTPALLCRSLALFALALGLAACEGSGEPRSSEGGAARAEHTSGTAAGTGAGAAPGVTADAEKSEAAPERGEAASAGATQEDEETMSGRDEAAAGKELEVATFGAGCFWCVEAVLEQLDGVHEVTSGYMGGTVDDPTYRQVCTGETGHAEVVQVRFDPALVSYETLLAWFWKLHDPTTLNRQGADTGTQYRSAIFFHTPEQERAARAAKEAEDASGEHGAPIVTEITAASTFYPAEVDHQDYYRLNPRAGYCRMVIAPKLDKLGLEKQ